MYDVWIGVQGGVAGIEHLAMVVVVPSEEQRLVRAEQLAVVRPLLLLAGVTALWSYSMQVASTVHSGQALRCMIKYISVLRKVKAECSVVTIICPGWRILTLAKKLGQLPHIMQLAINPSSVQVQISCCTP